MPWLQLSLNRLPQPAPARASPAKTLALAPRPRKNLPRCLWILFTP